MWLLWTNDNWIFLTLIFVVVHRSGYSFWMPGGTCVYQNVCPRHANRLWYLEYIVRSWTLLVTLATPKRLRVDLKTHGPCGSNVNMHFSLDTNVIFKLTLGFTIMRSCFLARRCFPLFQTWFYCVSDFFSLFNNIFDIFNTYLYILVLSETYKDNDSNDNGTLDKSGLQYTISQPYACTQQVSILWNKTSPR